MYAHVDGRVVPETEARVSVFDRGFLYGDGIFESMRAVAGTVFRFDRHYDRLRGAADRIGLDLPLDAPGLRDAVRDLLARNALREARIRVTLTRGPGRPGDYVGAAGPVTRVITTAPFAPLDPAVRATGVRIAVATGRQPPPEVLDPALKSTSRLHLVLARREASARGAFEAVLLDAGGHLAEGTASNIFLVRQGRLMTPPAPGVGLPGVTRETVLDLAREAGIDATEEPVPSAALFEADEAFLTNTSWEVLPVTRVEARPVGPGRPGPIAALLLERYRERVRKECG